MDARTEHLIALVQDGARLEDAARAYGISGERVRQILKEGGMTARDLPGRAQKRRTQRPELENELAPVIEAMWREGMFVHEIARVFDVSCEAVHRLVCERLPASDRDTLTAGRLEDTRSADERLSQAMRKAALALGEAPGIDPDHRRRAQAVVDGWLAAYVQLATPAAPPSMPAEAPSASERRDAEELRADLERFKTVLAAGGLSGSTIHAYLFGSSLFVRWLAGEYVPRGRANH